MRDFVLDRTDRISPEVVVVACLLDVVCAPETDIDALHTSVGKCESFALVYIRNDARRAPFDRTFARGFHRITIGVKPAVRNLSWNHCGGADVGEIRSDCR